MKIFHYSELQQYLIVFLKTAVFATENKNGTDLSAVIQILQISINAIILFLDCDCDFHSHFMQNKIYMNNLLIGTDFLCGFISWSLSPVWDISLPSAAGSFWLGDKLGREPAQSSGVGADNPVNSRMYRETDETENGLQIIFGYFTAKIFGVWMTPGISKQPKKTDLLRD